MWAPGFVKGHLRIISLKEVEVADASPMKTVTAETYAQYPLSIRSRAGLYSGCARARTRPLTRNTTTVQDYLESDRAGGHGCRYRYSVDAFSYHFPSRNGHQSFDLLVPLTMGWSFEEQTHIVLS
jgi:hypothetical protein